MWCTIANTGFYAKCTLLYSLPSNSKTARKIIYEIISSSVQYYRKSMVCYIWKHVKSSQVKSSQNIFIQEVNIHIKYIGKTEAQWAYLSLHSWNWIWYITTSMLTNKQNKITGLSIGEHFNNVCHFRLTRLSCVPKNRGNDSGSTRLAQHKGSNSTVTL